VSFYGNGLQIMNSTAVANLLGGQFLGRLIYSGAKELSTWPVTSSQGQNVTVHSLSFPGSNATISSADVTLLYLGGSTYAGMVSTFDRNTTRSIISTIAIG
jgi:hypothetical protein